MRKMGNRPLGWRFAKLIKNNRHERGLGTGTPNPFSNLLYSSSATHRLLRPNSTARDVLRAPLRTRRVPTSARLVFDFAMSRTVLGPMPTPFSAPADCGGSPRIALRANGTASFNARWGAGCTISGLSSMEVYTESCFPSGLVSWFAGEGLLNTVAAYSPAAGCPQGLQTACSVAKERGQGGAAPTGLDPGLNYVWQGLTEGEMYVGCCPR